MTNARSSRRCSARAPPWTPSRTTGAALPSALSGAVVGGGRRCRRCGRARPVRQVDSAALGGVLRLHQRRRGAARRRRRSAHHEQGRVPPCRPQATPTGRTRRSVQANASPTRTSTEQARRVRRGGGAGAAAASAPPHRALLPHARRSPPPASSRAPRMHSRGAACRGRVLRRTPTNPRHDLRVALRTIGCCCRTAEGRARTYRIAAHSEAGAAHAALTGT